MPRAVSTTPRALSLFALAALAAGCGATVEMGPGAAALAPTLTPLVDLPPAIGWSGPGAQPRV